MNKAAFQIEKYTFDKVIIDLDNHKSSEINVDFDSKGIYTKTDSTFNLIFIFTAFNDDLQDKPFVTIQCNGLFKFENVTTFEEIPSYFYRNCIAILFPFVRAFVSMVTVQANIPPIMLPTMNLASLEEPLKQNTSQL